MSRPLIKASLVAAATLSLALINPLVLQGCFGFLTCPEIEPEPAPSYPAEEAAIKQGLEQSFSYPNEDGSLELTLTDVHINRIYTAHNLTASPDSLSRCRPAREIHLIQQALAISPCPPPERGPELSSYEISAVLNATWIPNEGEAIVLADNEGLYGYQTRGDFSKGTQGYLTDRRMDSKHLNIVFNTSDSNGVWSSVLSSVLYHDAETSFEVFVEDDQLVRVHLGD